MNKEKLDWKSHVQRAVDICGGEQLLADEIGKSRTLIYRLTTRSPYGLKSISPKVAKLIERATDGSVTRAELCPDIFEDLSTESAA